MTEAVQQAAVGKADSWKVGCGERCPHGLVGGWGKRAVRHCALSLPNADGPQRRLCIHPWLSACGPPLTGGVVQHDGQSRHRAAHFASSRPDALFLLRRV